MMLFASCFGADPAPPKNKRKLSKKMIGNPTNFKHAVHLGINSISEDDTLNAEDMSKFRASVIPRPPPPSNNDTLSADPSPESTRP
ncbi:hypothetical protein AYI68_g674 [Smittium mucronatum]|uniref:CRIB domain-containing protein n=1 Tax=Smittium mucronatum TaxID=133383 RepID=A0A1R0H7R0_9FUNG|nr:hypothetical protein AYI68_g674 [Smittium mucronatum]